MEIDFFLQYNSTSNMLNDGKATIRLPVDKSMNLWISLCNICLTFPQIYQASTNFGYLALVGTEIAQSGIRCLHNGAPTRGKLLFPLSNPASRYPRSVVYQEINLQPTDSMKLIYLNEELTEILGVEISATIHLATTSDGARSTI